MTYEELERAMEFIVQQHGRFEARFETKMEALLDQQAKNASGIMRLRELGMKLARAQFQMHKEFKEELAASRREFREFKEQLAESHRQTTETIREVAHLQRRNEVKLNALLAAMARQYGNGRGRKTS
jgi:tryptophanyl-tRNA synthetase